ncbi:MAG: amidophosphoribosyltransferase [Acidobacteria bacterium]|nr:MAG: amidophosphoribosyltransferase [Acidobacteriota bacterium]
MGVVSFVADSLIAVCVAPTCAACRQPLDSPTREVVCDTCWSSIVPITPPCCRTCGDPLPSWRVISLEAERCARCRRRPSPIVHSRAIGAYEGSLRRIIHAFKYDPRPSLAGPLAERLRDAGRDVLSGADALVPVPLHPARERTRGFNQARELARHLGTCLLDVLVRTERTALQADLPASRRHANVRHAFSLRRGADVTGRTLVVVDDVSTTGATLAACARPLLAAGAREVRALTAARVVSRTP